jgi:hypothetical protein
VPTKETNVDAFVQLALMAKARLVFESPDTFLSFPALSPLSYEPEQLTFGKPGDLTPQKLADLSEFARITNQIPRGVLAPVDEGEYLWDVYRDVLQTAQLSSGNLSPQDKARYDEAMAFLYARSADGFRQDSEALRAYRQYRDAVINAQEDYKNQQLTAEASTDAAVQTRWRNEDEPRLRQEVKRLEDEWLTRGFKAQVEAAQQVEQACTARAPSLIWDEWKTAFIEDLDKETDTSLINYAVTGFSPRDVFDGESWPRFNLTRAEMTRLAAQAPAELLAIFGSSQPSTAIESVSFEYRSVAVARSWLRPTLFKSRFWRLPAGTEPLSEGADLSHGRCPAYITALVFARNVSVQVSQAGGPRPVPVHTGPLLRVDPETRFVRAETIRPRQVQPVARVATVGPAGRSPAAATMRMAPMAMARPAVAMRPATAPPPAAQLVTAQKATVRLQQATFVGLPPATTRPPAPGPGTPTPPPPTVAPTPEVSILAFVCKRLPRSPDPDPGLSWL